MDLGWEVLYGCPTIAIVSLVALATALIQTLRSKRRSHEDRDANGPPLCIEELSANQADAFFRKSQEGGSHDTRQ
jgi:hypothetical protein